MNSHENASMLDSLTVCLDMRGCPNRCHHCWLGHAPNPRLTAGDLRAVRDAFRPCARELEIDTWTREPDYADNYRELWALRTALSDRVTPHFELMSVWRAARNPEYIPWLHEMGVREMQLTFFGGEAMTDRYAGRRGYYRESVLAVEQLLRHGIAPRIQVFLNRETARELDLVEAMIRALRLPERCRDLGREFAAFVHAGSCDGANEQNYPIRPTPREVAMIPPFLAERTLRHFGKRSLEEVFGRGESEWTALFLDSDETGDFASEAARSGAVFYVDGDMNVYPNFSAPECHWRLGNLREDGAGAIVGAFLGNRSIAQRTRLTVPLKALARACGNPEGEGLFARDDYVIYLLNRYCRDRSGQ